MVNYQRGGNSKIGKSVLRYSVIYCIDNCLTVLGVTNSLTVGTLLLNTSRNKLHTSKYSPSLNFDEFPSNILCILRSFLIHHSSYRLLISFS